MLQLKMINADSWRMSVLKKVWHGFLANILLADWYVSHLKYIDGILTTEVLFLHWNVWLVDFIVFTIYIAKVLYC